MKKNKIKIFAEAGSSIKNKTGSWRTIRPVLLKDKCTGCGTCQKYCPDGAIKIVNGKMKINIDYCKGCAICSVECPTHSIIMKKEEK